MWGAAVTEGVMKLPCNPASLFWAAHMHYSTHRWRSVCVYILTTVFYWNLNSTFPSCWNNYITHLLNLPHTFTSTSISIINISQLHCLSSLPASSDELYCCENAMKPNDKNILNSFTVSFISSAVSMFMLIWHLLFQLHSMSSHYHNSGWMIMDGFLESNRVRQRDFKVYKSLDSMRMKALEWQDRKSFNILYSTNKFECKSEK